MIKETKHIEINDNLEVEYDKDVDVIWINDTGMLGDSQTVTLYIQDLPKLIKALQSVLEDK